MGILADWKRRKRVLADVEKRRQQRRRELILEWYKLLKPFQQRRDGLLGALADDLSENAIDNIKSWITGIGGIWTVIVVLLYLFVGEGWWHLMAARFGPLLFYVGLWLFGYIVIIGLSFHYTKDDMRYRLEKYASGWWLAIDPVTGKEIYPPVKCPECKKKYNIDRYLRYLEPCERCGYNIDWEAAKLPNKQWGNAAGQVPGFNRRI